jgi:hypothetical protein
MQVYSRRSIFWELTQEAREYTIIGATLKDILYCGPNGGDQSPAFPRCPGLTLLNLQEPAV